MERRLLDTKKTLKTCKLQLKIDIEMMGHLIGHLNAIDKACVYDERLTEIETDLIKIEQFL